MVGVKSPQKAWTGHVLLPMRQTLMACVSYTLGYTYAALSTPHPTPPKPALKKCQCLDSHGGTLMAAHADRSPVKSGTSGEHLSGPRHLILHWLNGNTGEEQQVHPEKKPLAGWRQLCVRDGLTLTLVQDWNKNQNDLYCVAQFGRQTH